MNKPDAWIEVVIPSAPEAMEVVSNFLFEMGSCGCEEGSYQIKAFFPADFQATHLQQRLAKYLGSLRGMGFSVGDPVFRKIPAEDWGSRWRENFKAVRVTSRIVVKPPWETLKTSSAMVVDIMPRMAFGTGTHETTRLALELLEVHLRPTDAVLDIGTGSGILAIVAGRLASVTVLVLDSDPDAVRNAKENTILNQVEDRVKIVCGSVDCLKRGAFDLVVANIDRKVLKDLLPKLKRLTKHDSRFIVSGILDSERQEMEEAFFTSGYRVVELRQKNEWLGYHVQWMPTK